MDHFQGNLQTCSWLVRHVNNWSRLIMTALSPSLCIPYQWFSPSDVIRNRIHVARTFKPPRPGKKRKKKKTPLPLSLPLCYWTNTITWWQTKKTSSAYTTNTTGKCDAPPIFTALPSEQGEMIWTEKQTIDWWAVQSWSSFSCNVTKPTIKRENSLPVPMHRSSLTRVCFSDYFWPTSTQRSAAFTFPPHVEKWLKRFGGFCFNYNLMAQRVSSTPRRFPLPLKRSPLGSLSNLRRMGGALRLESCPFQDSHGSGQVQEVKSQVWRGDRWDKEEEEVWGAGGGLSQLFLGAPGFGRSDEPLSRVSGGPWCPLRLCTLKARLLASATSPRNRIFLRVIKKAELWKHIRATWIKLQLRKCCKIYNFVNSQICRLVLEWAGTVCKLQHWKNMVQKYSKTSPRKSVGTSEPIWWEDSSEVHFLCACTNWTTTTTAVNLAD